MKVIDAIDKGLAKAEEFIAMVFMSIMITKSRHGAS